MEFIKDWEVLWDFLPHIAGLVIMVVAFLRGFKTDDFSSSMTTAGRNISCASINCVRCRAYVVRSKAALQQKWHNYIKELPDFAKRELSRLSTTMDASKSECIKDLQPAFELFGLETKPFHEAESFSGDVATLESSYDEILREFRNVVSNDLNWVVNSTPKGQWKAYYFINQGKRMESNMELCPVTTAVIDKLENMMTDCVFGNACFSVVNPGTDITEHYGPCNLRVRCHLGLEIPTGCRLTVDGITSGWERGKCTLFNDSYLHSVTHSGTWKNSLPRAILLVDFWSSDISIPERTALTHLLHHDSMTQSS